MKHADLERHLRKQGCTFVRQGKGSHEIWTNANGDQTAVLHHSEIDKALARRICRQLGIEPPAGA
jgi:predicted RNA binding protein YcfA (HicA-like mRNA interferase family)